ncbi:MAG: hypothetical protein ACRDJM_07810 [Actinomycetota bacterium]
MEPFQPPPLPQAGGNAPPRRLAAGTKIAIGALALAAVFGVVLAVELASSDKTPRSGDELLVAPTPVLPAAISGYRIVAEPDLADSLEEQYRATSVSVTDVEAASVPLRSAAASVVAARLDSRAKPSSSDFRAGVLTGAAGGFDINPAANPFTYRTVGRVVVYSTSAQQGRLYVWFFRDAFVQLFVPPAIAAEGDEIQRMILDAQLSRTATTLP